MLVDLALLHFLLNTLGYSSEREIFIRIDSHDVRVILKAENREVLLCVGTPELPEQEMLALWRELCVEWNTGGSIDDEEKDALYSKSGISLGGPMLVFTLLSHGFTRMIEIENADMSQKH